MFKKNFISLIILFFTSTSVFSATDVYIFASVNDEIITNHDIEKESQYLQILNNNLSNLEKEKIWQISKDSLINEIIKKKEIEKFYNLDDENSLVTDYLKNLYTKLNYNSENEFKASLASEKNYSINEIKQKLKIEILWNEIIYSRYKNQIKIDKDALKKKIENKKKETRKEFFLSEIVFKKKIDREIESLIEEIKNSIKEIGFNNTANIYSISESSKLGGKVGWIDENNLSEIIFNKVNDKKSGEYTDVIKIGNNHLFIKVEEIRINEISINENEELNKIIKFETNRQLNQFSRIFFNKIKVNYSINES
tara:strand:- start:104 stop:1033 length:930 start_codon:yes stop_codon:yes gene_type:complete